MPDVPPFYCLLGPAFSIAWFAPPIAWDRTDGEVERNSRVAPAARTKPATPLRQLSMLRAGEIGAHWGILFRNRNGLRSLSAFPKPKFQNRQRCRMPAGGKTERNR